MKQLCAQGGFGHAIDYAFCFQRNGGTRVPARRPFRDKASTVSVNQETRKVTQQFLTQPFLSVRRLINAVCSFAFLRKWLETGLHRSDVRPSLLSSTVTGVTNRWWARFLSGDA